MKVNPFVSTLLIGAAGAVVGYLAVDLVEYFSAVKRKQDKSTGVFTFHPIENINEEIISGPVDLTGCIPIGGGFAGGTIFSCPNGKIITV